MLAIGSGTTLTVATPLRDPAAAVISAVPSALAVTRPDDDTDATVDAEEDHATCCPERMFPLASLTVADSCSVCPTCRSDKAGDTSTVATAGGGSEPPPPQAATRSPGTKATQNRAARPAAVENIIFVREMGL